MSSLKSRIDKLHTGVITKVTSQIKVIKDNEVIKSHTYGTNKNKVIQIIVNL